jgi:hypothetical protein
MPARRNAHSGLRSASIRALLVCVESDRASDKNFDGRHLFGRVSAPERARATTNLLTAVKDFVARLTTHRRRARTIGMTVVVRFVAPWSTTLATTRVGILTTIHMTAVM